MRCLYDGGDGSLAPSPGNVFIVGASQGTTPTTVYKGQLRSWLGDSAFWETMARSVRWWGQEAYGSPAFTMVPDTSRNERSRSLSDYLYAVANLAESGPDEITVARDFLRDAYYPLSNAAWRYTTGFGFTEVPVETMQQFASLQEYTIRASIGSRPQTAAALTGYAWAPRNVPAQPASIFTAETLGARKAPRLLDPVDARAGRELPSRGLRPARRDDLVRGRLGGRFVQPGLGPADILERLARVPSPPSS